MNFFDLLPFTYAIAAAAIIYSGRLTIRPSESRAVSASRAIGLGLGTIPGWFFSLKTIGFFVIVTLIAIVVAVAAGYWLGGADREASRPLMQAAGMMTIVSAVIIYVIGLAQLPYSSVVTSAIAGLIAISLAYKAASKAEEESEKSEEE